MNNTLKKWKIGWGITNRCNMNCSFCYSKSVRACNSDLPLENLKSFIDRNHPFIESINYGTGENTMSEDWFSIVKYIRATYPGIDQALTTNGYLNSVLVSRSDYKTILQALSEVDVSLDFHNPGRHNSLRKNHHAYEWAMSTIHRCRTEGIETTIVVMGTNETLQVKNLEGIFTIAEDTGSFVRINIYRPVNNNGLAYTDYHVLKRAIKWLLQNHKIVSLGDPLFSALILGKEFQDKSGITSLRILHDGSVTPSTYLISDEWKRANIMDVDLFSLTFTEAGPCPQPMKVDETIFSRLKKSSQENKFLSNTDIIRDSCSGWIIPVKCGPCKYRNVCKGGTIDRRYLWHKTLEEPDPYCPLLNNDTLENWTCNSNITFSRGPGIHDGYLPTMIFAP